MNVNVKLDGEEEQGIQYVNRFAINIPSTAFNLNIVNSGLNNQGYILNPVSPVGQNIVTYQPSTMAVQSYFALPTESEGNILHSLPVGVSVPVGLPVQTGFLQNNFLNTSIIIGNDNCNSQDALASSPNQVDQADDSKSNYLEKPIEEFIDANDGQNIGLTSSPVLNIEGVIKKPCPLEMSIKAANIDIEFEKCEQEIPILVTNSLEINSDKLTIDTLNGSATDNLQISLTESPMQQPLSEALSDVKCQQKKTEITWDESTVKQNLTDSNFQESLICEVEEVNDDEGGEEDGGDDEEFHSKRCIQRAFHRSENSDDSSNESDGLPLSIASKLSKLSDSKKNVFDRKRKKSKIKNTPNKTVANKDKFKTKKGRKAAEIKEKDEEWSDSDDDVLDLMRFKNEFNYKCYFEPKKTSTNSLILKLEEGCKKFARVRSCCSKKECGKKISVKEQMAVHKHFYDLDSNLERDLYLTNCIEHVQKNSKNFQGKGAQEKSENELINGDIPLSTTNIQMEIENESNGNQKLSDEIQNAINESLKDCGVLELNEKSTQEEMSQNSDKEEKNNWNYYIVIEETRKKVCLQFLLKLLRITKNRIKQLQKKILSGIPLINESNNLKSDIKLDEVWAMAKTHLAAFDDEECINCHAVPRHRFLIKNQTRDQLFVNFKEFYSERTGKELAVKFPAYKRFLDRETSLSFLPKDDYACAECNYSKIRKKQQKSAKDNKATKKKKSEDRSEEESSAKYKKLKLTIPLKGIGPSMKGNENQGKRSGKKGPDKKETKVKGRQSAPSRGRDVWSLMLLHLETMPYKECNSCGQKKKHRFLDSTFTTQGLFEDYRKYFLKETNSELGLGFTMYEKYFNRNCNYTIMDLKDEETRCPRCVSDQSRC